MPRLPSLQTLPPAIPGVFRGAPRPAEWCSLSSVYWVFLETSSRWDMPGTTPRGHPKQVSKPLQLTPRYSELLLSDWASHPISKGTPSHQMEESLCTEPVTKASPAEVQHAPESGLTYCQQCEPISWSDCAEAEWTLVEGHRPHTHGALVVLRL